MPRIAIIEKNKCKNGVDCPFICGSVCPVNRAKKECIVIGQDNKPMIKEELCIGCAICVKKCPFEAIRIINLPAALEKPIHRFGVNQFALYSLPIPIFGKVVGILGQNGIGKTTAISIVAGLLKPNLGEPGKEAEYKEVIKFFKGTEAQDYFEKLNEGKIKVSFKPQQVDLIPKTHKGKVRALLEKVDEKKQLEKIAEELELTEILDSNINDISGGELQRVAIAATVLKKANLYVFDEPTSFLDIKQRLKLVKFIRSLVDENTAVLVVEHDLIVMDSISDLVHIMYGEHGCYGIVSLPRTARAGINIYLEGYLKEENIRFRQKAVRFEAKPPINTAQQNILTSWHSIEKRLDKFNLKAEEGSAFKNEIVGILGQNGIGKTTFVKILAGVIKQDRGKIEEKITVSYKPQYLESESNVLVSTLLKDAIEKYSTQIITPLNIKPLFEKRLNQLSGGELQRVAIALCLSKEADLYLLDEPSAYLDVEQRLAVSKIIRELMEHKNATAFVVDHDLLFLDYISQRLLVFEGIPAKYGEVKGPFSMEQGMNLFLKELGITFRRDPESNRPRANKPDSIKDREQKKEGKYYYV